MGEQQNNRKKFILTQMHLTVVFGPVVRQSFVAGNVCPAKSGYLRRRDMEEGEEEREGERGERGCL